MHCIWENRLTDKFKEYQEFFEAIQLTPRYWNTKTKLPYILKYITWTLNININLLGFRRTKINPKCGHIHTYFLYYKFQNTLVKMLRKPHPFKSLNIFIYKNEFYKIQTSIPLKPVLISGDLQTLVPYNNVNVLCDHVATILTQKPVSFPFSINIYSSYLYLRKYSTSEIATNLIGKYVCDSNDNSQLLHIFIAPNLEGNDFEMCGIANMTNKMYHTINNLANSHAIEGRKLFNKLTNQSQKLLNQNSCVCDHPDTQRIFLPTKFKNLGEFSYYLFSFLCLLKQYCCFSFVKLSKTLPA